MWSWMLNNVIGLGLPCHFCFALIIGFDVPVELPFWVRITEKKCPSNSTLDMSWISTDKWRNTEVSFVCFFFFFEFGAPFRISTAVRTPKMSRLMKPVESPQSLPLNTTEQYWTKKLYRYMIYIYIIEGSLEVKLPTIWTDEKQSRAEAERRERSEERRVEEKE